jgi:hypothetical protein
MTARSALIAGAQAKISAIRDAVTASAAERTRAFLEGYVADPDPKLLAAWFGPRAWREIEYVFMLGEELRRYGLTFERPHMTALARQIEDEAEHYDAVGRIIEELGGVVPTTVPASAVTWSDFLWESLDRHRLGAVAAWYISETAAMGSMDGTMRLGEQLSLPRVVRVYTQILADEKFHLGLGRTLLERYCLDEHDLSEILRAMHGMAEILAETAYVVEA